MRSRNILLHLSVLVSATAWEIFLAYQRWLYSYYITGASIKVNGGFICHLEYSPTLIFVLLVFLPTMTLLAPYAYLKIPILKKSGLSVGAPMLLVVLTPLVSNDAVLWLLGILIASSLSGFVLGKEKLEKGLLTVQGFLPAFIVLTIIGGGLYVAC